MAKVYVQDNGDGTYSTVYESNGAYEVIYTGDQSTAENNANVVRETRLGQSPTPAPRTSPTPRSGGGGGAGTSGDISDILRAIAESNDIDLAEKIRQFNETLAWAKEQFEKAQGVQKEQLRLDYNKAVMQVRASMLGIAAQLKGPENYLSFLEYTGGGMDPFSRISGSEAAPAFGAPTGHFEKSNMGDAEYPDYLPPEVNPTANLSTEAAYDWIWSKRPDLKGFFEGAGWDVSTPEKQRLAVKEWIEKTDPQWRGKTAQQVAAELGYKAPTTTPGPTNPPQTGDFPIETAYTQQRGTISPGGRSMPSPMDYLGGNYDGGAGTARGIAYQNARKAAGDYREDFRPPPQGWQPGMPVGGQYDPNKLRSFKDTLISRGTIGTKPAPVRPPGGGYGGFLPDELKPAYPDELKPMKDYGGSWPDEGGMGSLYDKINRLGRYGPRGDYGGPVSPPDNSGDWEYGNYMPQSRNGEPTLQAFMPGWRNRRTGEVKFRNLESRYGNDFLPGEPNLNQKPGYPRFPGDTGSPPPVGGPQPTPQPIPGYGGARDPIPPPAPPPSENPDNPPPGMDPGLWSKLSPTARSLYRTQGYLIPNPHQIHPAVWDSMDDEAKKFYLSVAEKGYTPGGNAWTAERYLSQLNAARPKGTAPRRVSMSYNQPQSLF